MITFILAFYLAVNSCEKSYYFSYSTTYHSITPDDYPENILLDTVTHCYNDFQPGKFVKYPANFYPGLNMITISGYRFSLN